jgi:hypothetical protein
MGSQDHSKLSGLSTLTIDIEDVLVTFGSQGGVQIG